MSIGLVKGIKIFTALGLIISLAVVIIAGICLLAAAAIDLARGGHGGGGHRNHPLMYRLSYLFFQLRQILWLYAVCGGGLGGGQDPFLRDVAGVLAFMMSICCGNPMSIFFWMRADGMGRRWRRGGAVSRRWGGNSSWNSLGNSNGGDIHMDGIAMVRRGTWGDDNDNQHTRHYVSSQSLQTSDQQQQRGLLSIAVEVLFGSSDPDVGKSSHGNNLPSPKELEKWKFRASVIMALSSASEGRGVSLRELLSYVDNPPESAGTPTSNLF